MIPYFERSLDSQLAIKGILDFIEFDKKDKHAFSTHKHY
jgi:hypothetical protein